MLFLLFEAAEFMCVNTDREKLSNLRIILYKECNKCDVTSWVTVHYHCQIVHYYFSSQNDFQQYPGKIFLLVQMNSLIFLSLKPTKQLL